MDGWLVNDCLTCGDWSNDNDLHDQTWMDLPHYELL